MIRRKKVAFKPVLRKPTASNNVSGDGVKNKAKSNASKAPVSKATSSEQPSDATENIQETETQPCSKNGHTLPNSKNASVSSLKHSTCDDNSSENVQDIFASTNVLINGDYSSENGCTSIQAVSSSTLSAITSSNEPLLSIGQAEVQQPRQDTRGQPEAQKDSNENLATVDSSTIVSTSVDEESVVSQKDATSTNLPFSKHKSVAASTTVPTFPANKSREQIVKEQFGLEDKSIRQRNALKKLKNIETLNEKATMEDWNNMVRDSLLMSDLIYCNPPKSAAKEIGFTATLKKMKENKKRKKKSTSGNSQDGAQSVENEADKTASQEASVLAPQIRLNEDGSIVLDEESLVINSSKPDTAVHDTPVVYENSFTNVGHSNFRRTSVCKRPRWTEKQTEKFYEALKIVGADFSLMSAMFRNRNDKQLRKKFQLERKKHNSKADEALKQQHLSKWTNVMFKPESSSDEESSPVKRRKRRRKNTSEKRLKNNPSESRPDSEKISNTNEDSINNTSESRPDSEKSPNTNEELINSTSEFRPDSEKISSANEESRNISDSRPDSENIPNANEESVPAT